MFSLSKISGHFIQNFKIYQKKINSKNSFYYQYFQNHNSATCLRKYLLKSIKNSHNNLIIGALSVAAIAKIYCELSLKKECELLEEMLTKPFSTEGLSLSSQKRIAPFLEYIDSSFMLHYIDKMEELLELPSPTPEESKALYEKILCSVTIQSKESTDKRFCSFVQELFLILTKSALGKMVLEEWIDHCDKLSLRPKVTQCPRNCASAPNEINLSLRKHYYSIYEDSFDKPAHITLAHEILHCTRMEYPIEGRYKTPFTKVKPIKKELTNAEEQYTILGIEKQLYMQDKNQVRLFKYLCEATFLISEGLPPRLNHYQYRPSTSWPKDLLQSKIEYYKFIAKYTENQIDLIHEKRDNEEIVLKAVRENGLMYKYASNQLQQDAKVMLSALKSDPSVYPLMAINLRDARGLEILTEVIQNKEIETETIQKKSPLIRFIEREHPFYEQCALSAVKADANLYCGEEWEKANPLFFYNVYKSLSMEERRNSEIALRALENCKDAFFFLPLSLQQSKSFCNAAVWRNIELLELFVQANPSFAQDHDLMIHYAYNRVKRYNGPPELLRSPEFFQKIAKVNLDLAVREFPKEFYGNKQKMLSLVDYINDDDDYYPNFKIREVSEFYNQAKKLGIDFKNKS